MKGWFSLVKLQGKVMMGCCSLVKLQDKIMMGAERRSMVQTAQCRRNTAYHEAGHALVALKTQGAEM